MDKIRRAQLVLQEMSKAIAEALEKNSIPYMLAYGTLLGAVRHGGFIPWDDDFDFYLFDDCYEEAVECLRRELPDTMFVEDAKSEPLYFHAWAHVKDINSRAESGMYPHDNLYSHHGISVDLYRIKKLRLSELRSWVNSENEKYIERRREKGLISREEYERRIERLNQNKSVSQTVGDDREVYSLRTNFKWFELDEVFPLKRMRFEDRDFNVPNEYEKILVKLYGDYMKLPLESERHGHYDTLEFY